MALFLFWAIWLLFQRILIIPLNHSSLMKFPFTQKHTQPHTHKERVDTNHIIIKKTFAKNITSFIACLRPKIIAYNEGLWEQRNFNPLERPQVSETCSNIDFPNCLTSCMGKTNKEKNENKIHHIPTRVINIIYKF